MRKFLLWLKWALTPEERIIHRLVRLTARDHLVSGVDHKGEYSGVRLIGSSNLYGVCYYQIIDKNNRTLWTGKFDANLTEDGQIVFNGRYAFDNKEFINARCNVEMEAFKLISDTKFATWKHLSTTYTPEQLAWLLAWKN